MSPSSANAALTTKIGSGAVPMPVSSRNVNRGPMRAPVVSIVRCTPNAPPSWSGGTAWVISASRGAVRSPLPARSTATISPMPNPDAPMPSMPTRVRAESAYPAPATAFGRRHRSDRWPPTRRSTAVAPV